LSTKPYQATEAEQAAEVDEPKSSEDVDSTDPYCSNKIDLQLAF
jgi:hypothetical protein